MVICCCRVVFFYTYVDASPFVSLRAALWKTSFQGYIRLLPDVGRSPHIWALTVSRPWSPDVSAVTSLITSPNLRQPQQFLKFEKIRAQFSDGCHYVATSSELEAIVALSISLSCRYFSGLHFRLYLPLLFVGWLPTRKTVLCVFMFNTCVYV